MNRCGHVNYLRWLADLCERENSPAERPETILRRVAGLIEMGAAFDDEATDPALTLICPHCGQMRPASWTPPKG